MDKSKHLESVVKTHQITKEEELLNKHIKKKNEVKEALEEKYGSDVYSPFNSGSYAKNTAINTKFDFDLVSPFKRNAFGSNGTLKEMYEDVYDFLYEKYKDVAEVKKQKVSIGLEFYADSDADVIKIDVVPGRELNQGQYKNDENLNLYVYYKYGNIDAGSGRIKTNIKSQINNIKGRANAEKDSIRKIIRLLKVWKNNKGTYPTKSFFLELITIKAFDNTEMSGNLWDKLKTVLEYIRDNVTKDSFTLKDPGNSSNDLEDTLTSYEKQQLSDDMKNMLDRIEENDENIKTYFPENPKFKEEDSNKNKYGTTGGILCSTNSFTHKNNDTITKHIQALDNLKSIDLGCIADYGSFYIDYNPNEEITIVGQDAYLEFYTNRKFKKIRFSDASHSFVTFFMQLTRYLQQAIGTIPAINLNAYLKNIGEEVDEQI